MSECDEVSEGGAGRPEVVKKLVSEFQAEIDCSGGERGCTDGLARTEPDSMGFLDRDAPLIFTSQYLRLKVRRKRRSAGGVDQGGAQHARGGGDGPKKGLANHKFPRPELFGSARATRARAWALTGW